MRRRLITATAAALVLVAGLSWLVAFSPVLGVRTVDVRGTSLLSADAVRSAARISRGTPLVRLDKARIRARVQALPEVAAATVHTSFPSTVTITVHERIAVGVVRSGSGFRLVDRTGDQFRSVPSAPTGLPLFAVPAGAAGRTAGQAVATVAAALPQPIRAKVVSISAMDPESISLLLRDQVVVRWGNSTRSAEKARVLGALLGKASTQIDLTDPNLPFTR
jgi:cell division protein FtsQ